MKRKWCRSFFQSKIQNPKSKIAFPLFLLFLLWPGQAHSQSLQCWSWSTTLKTWVYNQACSGSGASPWQIAAGKTFTVDNSLTLLGTDNAQLNIGNGGTLGSAAFASSTQFQPSGAATGLSSTAGDSLAIGTGSTTFHTSAGLAYALNMVVTAYYTSNVAIFMQGAVTSYNSTTGVLVVNVTNTGGSGTYTAWTISISGPQGAAGATGAAGVPVGAMVEWPAGHSSVPTNWMWANGTCVSQATYSALYAVLGNTWTAHDGCTGSTFGLPDTLARTPVGEGQGATGQGGTSGTNQQVGTVGGAETHTLTASELPANIPYNDPGHSHSINGGVPNVTGNYFALTTNSGYLYNTGTSTTNITINPGGGGSHTIMAPFYVATKIIRYQ